MTTNVGIMFPTHGEVHSKQSDEIKTTFVRNLVRIVGFLQFHHTIKLTATI